MSSASQASDEDANAAGIDDLLRLISFTSVESTCMAGDGDGAGTQRAGLTFGTPPVPELARAFDLHVAPTTPKVDFSRSSPNYSSNSSSISSSPVPAAPQACPPLVQLPPDVATPGGGLWTTWTTSACTSMPTSTSHGAPSTVSTPPRTTPTRLTRWDADRHYGQILSSMLDQSRSVEMAYGWGEAEERGISWRELLHTNLMYVQLLSDQPPEEKVDGTETMSVDSSAFPVDPREHYLPILLEGARVWRRAVMETIDRRLDRDIKDKNYSAWEERSEHDDRYRTAQHLIPPVDRRLLARQARRIVRRYLVLHNVFPTSETEDKIHSWDDFSKSSVIGSAHFLDFVYYEFLRPAFNMGWGGLICEKMDDEASPASSSLLGPVVGALQNILAKTKGQSSVSFGYDPDHTKRKRVIGWVRNQHARLAQLGEATAILEAKVAALGRITKTDGSTHMEEDGCSQRYGRDHTFDEANIILDDCVDDWTSLAEHRHSGQSKSYGTGVADKLAITANQIVHTYKRFHRVDSAGPTSNKVHRLTEFVYNKFLLPGHNLDIPKLATSTQAVGHESLVGTYTRGMHSIHSASSESQTAAFGPTNLRRIDICPLTWNLRVKLDSLEGCSESSQAPELLQSCLALWKSAALAFSDQGQCADQVGDESKLIVLAGRLTLQHQCIQKTNASGVDFSTSCIKETTSILDFVYDNFLCYGSEFDIDFARMHQNKAKRVSFPGLSGREMSPNHQDHKTHCNLRDGPYEIIIGAIQNLNEMGRNDLAREYYDKFCLAGTENGEHKAYLDAELPFIASF